jgi:hypothetical protein
MAKQTVTIHVYAKTGEYDKPGSVSIHAVDFRGHAACMSDLVWLCQQEVVIDIPEDDMTQVKIDNLRKMVDLERADSQVRVNRLVERISKLQAIGHDD